MDYAGMLKVVGDPGAALSGRSFTAFAPDGEEFAFAVVLTRVDVLTFTVKISHYFGNQTTSWAWIAGLAVLGSLPVFIAVLVMQRYLVRGISMGAIKG